MEYSHTVLQKLLTMQMCAPLCKSVHQIVSEQEIQLSNTWAASIIPIIPSFQWLWHGSNFWGSSSGTFIPFSGALVSSGHLPLAEQFSTCRAHCKDEQKNKRCRFLSNSEKPWHLRVKPDCGAEASRVCSGVPPKLSFFAPLKMETGQPKVSP